MIKSTTRQYIKYNFYASLLSYILLLQRFGLKSQEQHASPQKPRSESTNKRERDLGRNLVSWQEKVVGNDPTGWNPRRAAGDGDTIRVSGTVLEREREREIGGGERNRRMGMGELELPLLALNPHAPSAAR